MNPTAPRICSGVPDCPSSLWVPGSSGLRVWTCPPALLEAYQSLASQSSGELRQRAAVGAGQRGPLDTGDAGLCRMARGCKGPASPRSSHLHLCLFFLSHSQPGALGPHPTRQMGRQRCGERGGSEGPAPGFPPFALHLPLPCAPDSTQVLLCRPCPPSFSHSPTMISGTNPIFTGVGLPRVSLLRSKTDKYLKEEKKIKQNPSLPRQAQLGSAPRPRSSSLQAERPRGSAERGAG